jgi:hypothetical protein
VLPKTLILLVQIDNMVVQLVLLPEHVLNCLVDCQCCFHVLLFLEVLVSVVQQSQLVLQAYDILFICFEGF